MSPAPTGEGAVRDLAQASERTITVTSTDILRSGFNGRKKWTLFAIKANDEDGDPITDDLRSFQKIEPGLRRCVFEDYKGEAWTLREIADPATTKTDTVRARRSEASAKLTGKTDATPTAAPDTGELAELTRRMDELEGRFALLTNLLPGGGA